MRAEMSEAVGSFIQSLNFADAPPAISQEDENWLSELTTLAARCRSYVSRNPYDRQIEDPGDSRGTRADDARANTTVGRSAIDRSESRAVEGIDLEGCARFNAAVAESGLRLFGRRIQQVGSARRHREDQPLFAASHSARASGA